MDLDHHAGPRSLVETVDVLGYQAGQQAGALELRQGQVRRVGIGAQDALGQRANPGEEVLGMVAKRRKGGDPHRIAPLP
jgi:hypothetical protein